LTRATAQNSEMDSLRGAGVAQLVERVLAKHEVVGSKPITRSNKFCKEIDLSINERSRR
jgi:hypothetical protein